MTAPLSVARLPPRRRRRLGLVVLVLLFALFLLLSNLVPLAAEWLWFQALGYERVFTTRLVAEAVLGVAVGGAVFAFLYANLRIAQRGLVPNPLVVQVSSGAAAVDVTRLLRRLALPTALGLALLFGMGAAGGWLGVLQFLHRTPFGVRHAERRPVQELEHTKPAACGAHAEQQRQAERRRQGQAAQQPGDVHGGGSGAELDDQRVRGEAALGDPQVDVEEREHEAADPHAEHRLGHEPGREHALVTHGLEPEPFGGERDQIGEEQQEGEQDDQHDQAQATPPTRRQTGYA